MDWYLDQISNCTYRQFTTGFFFGKPDESAQIYDNNTYVKEYTYLGIIGECTADGLYRIEQRNKFSVGEQIEIMNRMAETIPASRSQDRGRRRAGDAICAASEASFIY